MDHQLCSGELLELDFGMEAPVLAARLITQTPPERPLPRAAFHLATTKSTNALLERKGDPTAFVVTKGFKDLLKIGDQRRPDLFALNIDQADPLHDLVFEFDHNFIFLNLSDALALFDKETHEQDLEIYIEDPMKADIFKKKINTQINSSKLYRKNFFGSEMLFHVEKILNFIM